MSRIHVFEPGFLTTVQDLGRFGYAHFGISASGAADSLALRAGNLLVGNADGTGQTAFYGNNSWWPTTIRFFGTASASCSLWKKTSR